MNTLREFRWQYLPGVFLCVAIPLLLVIRESDPVFWNSISVRVLPTLLALIAAFMMRLALKYPPQGAVSPFVYQVTQLFLICACVSTYLGPYPSEGMTRLLEMTSVALFALNLKAYLDEYPGFRLGIYLSVSTLVLVIAAGLVRYWYSLEDPFSHYWTGELPFFDHIRHSNYLLTLGAPLAFWLWHSDNTKVRGFSFVVYSVCWAMIIWTGGRSGFLGVLIATLIYLALQPRSIVWVVLGFIIGLWLSWQFPVGLGHLNLFRSFSTEQGIASYETANALSAGRLTIYLKSLAYWWEHAPFWGLGADTYRYVSNGIVNLKIAMPHSVAVQLLFSYGLPGLLLISLLAWRYVRNVWESKEFIAALPVLAASINSLSDGNFYHSMAFFMTITVMVASLSPTQHSRTSTEVTTEKRVITFPDIVWLGCFLLACVFLIQVLASSQTMPAGYYFWRSLLPLYI